MPEIAVLTAVFKEDTILLTKREDFELWCLPGGGVEEDETVAQAAIRETKEETGIEIELSSLVGIYSRTGIIPTAHIVLFTGKQIGGEIKTQPGETIDVKYFPLDEIPKYLTPGHKKRIEDAISERGGSVAVHQIILSKGGQNLQRENIIALRELSRDERLKAFREKLKGVEIRSETEVGYKSEFS